MKRILFAATAVLALGVPMAAPAFADPPHAHRHHDHGPNRVVVVKRETHAHVGGRIDHRDRRYREVDYRDYRLKEPPRGYHYVRDDNTGEIVLAAIVGGLITALILN
jgi:Ni/Co efflux regulator RcnB